LVCEALLEAALVVDVPLGERAAPVLDAVAFGDLRGCFDLVA
jgi:hypothetical protein